MSTKKAEKEKMKQGESNMDGRLFGSKLPEVRGQTGAGHVPPIVLELVTFLVENDAAAEEGLFRIAGSSSTIDALKAAYDRDQTVDLQTFSPTPGVHDVASLVKTYIRSLEEPLFICRYYDSMISIAKSADNDEATVQKLVMVLQKLPVSNRDTLLFLLSYLRDVSLRSDENKMTIENLSVVWAPNFIREPPEKAAQALFDAEYSKRAVIAMMTNVDSIRERCREADAKFLKRDPTKTAAAGAIETIHAAGVSAGRPRLASTKGRTWSPPVSSSTDVAGSLSGEEKKSNKFLKHGSLKLLTGRSRSPSSSQKGSNRDLRRGSLQEFRSVSEDRDSRHSPSKSSKEPLRGSLQDTHSVLSLATSEEGNDHQLASGSVRSASPTDVKPKKLVKNSNTEVRRARTWSQGESISALIDSTATSETSSSRDRKETSSSHSRSTSTSSHGGKHTRARRSKSSRRWVSIAEPDKSRIYFNLASKERTTIKPADYRSRSKSRSSVDWQSVTDDTGKVYYVNTRTKERVWTLRGIRSRSRRHPSSASKLDGDRDKPDSSLPDEAISDFLLDHADCLPPPPDHVPEIESSLSSSDCNSDESDGAGSLPRQAASDPAMLDPNEAGDRLLLQTD